MAEEREFVTVYRSADLSAESDTEMIRGLLAEAGIDARVVSDDLPGVVTGTYEVRVPVGDALQAEELIAEAAPEVEEGAGGEVDTSHDLDLVTVFRAESSNSSEIEVMSIQSVLKAGGIESVMIDNPMMPNLPVEVRVAREDEPRALAVIAEAQAAGPEAAEEAERATEPGAAF